VSIPITNPYSDLNEVYEQETSCGKINNNSPKVVPFDKDSKNINVSMLKEQVEREFLDETKPNPDNIFFA